MDLFVRLSNTFMFTHVRFKFRIVQYLLTDFQERMANIELTEKLQSLICVCSTVMSMKHIHVFMLSSILCIYMFSCMSVFSIMFSSCYFDNLITTKQEAAYCGDLIINSM